MPNFLGERESIAIRLRIGKFLAYNNHDYAKARQRLQEAADLGFDDPEVNRLIAQSFVLEDNQEGGLTYLDGVIGEQVDAGATPTDEMLELGFSLAYENGSYDKAADYALMRAEYYPSDTTWRNAIAVQRNFGEFSDAEILAMPESIMSQAFKRYDVENSPQRKTLRRSIAERIRGAK